jgi:hypothetical protein
MSGYLVSRSGGPEQEVWRRRELAAIDLRRTRAEQGMNTPDEQENPPGQRHPSPASHCCPSLYLSLCSHCSGHCSDAIITSPGPLALDSTRSRSSDRVGPVEHMRHHAHANYTIRSSHVAPVLCLSGSQSHSASWSWQLIVSST